MLPLETVDRLRAHLRRLVQMPDTPTYDTEWLIVRCDDSWTYTGNWRRASLRQLKKDVAQFVNRFPGLIPEFLVDAVEKIDR